MRRVIRPLRLAGPALLAWLAGCDHPRQTAEASDIHGVPPFTGRAGSIGRVDTLVRASVIGDSTTWGQPTAVTVLDDWLLIGDRFASPHLTVVDRREHAVRFRFGKTGDGPAEFRVPLWLFPAGGAPHSAWVYDSGRRDFTRLDLDQPPDSMIQERFRFNPARQLAFPIMTRDTVVATAYSTTFVLMRSTMDGAIIDSTIVEQPFGPPDVPDLRGRLMANAKRLAFRPSSHHIVLAYMHAGRLEYFSPQGIHRGTAYGPRQNRVAFGYRGDQFGFEREHEGAYMHVTATDRFVYGLYCGCQADFNYDKVHVFDWAGNFVTEFVLDHPVAVIAVTPEDRLLYGVQHEPWPSVGIWTLDARTFGEGTK